MSVLNVLISVIVGNKEELHRISSGHTLEKISGRRVQFKKFYVTFTFEFRKSNKECQGS